MKPCDRCNKFTCVCVPLLAVAPNDPGCTPIGGVEAVHGYFLQLAHDRIDTLEERVAALEAMLRPAEVVAADWSIPLHRRDCICVTCENLRRDITAMATHWSRLINKESK